MNTTPFIGPRTKACPFCAEIIQAAAIKCRFCGEFLNTERARAAKHAGDDNYEKSDKTPVEKKNVLFKGRPSIWAMVGVTIKCAVVLVLAGFMMKLPLEAIVGKYGLKLSDNQALTMGQYRIVVGIGLAVLAFLILLLKFIKLKTIRYEVTADRIEWSRGIFDRQVDNLDMFRVIDLSLRRSLLDCMVGIGTVSLVTTDKTDPEFEFKKIHNARLLYDILKDASFEADKRADVVHLE